MCHMSTFCFTPRTPCICVSFFTTSPRPASLSANMSDMRPCPRHLPRSVGKSLSLGGPLSYALLRYRNPTLVFQAAPCFSLDLNCFLMSSRLVFSPPLVSSPSCRYLFLTWFSSNNCFLNFLVRVDVGLSHYFFFAWPHCQFFFHTCPWLFTRGDAALSFKKTRVVLQKTLLQTSSWMSPRQRIWQFSFYEPPLRCMTV